MLRSCAALPVLSCWREPRKLPGRAANVVAASSHARENACSGGHIARTLSAVTSSPPASSASTKTVPGVRPLRRRGQAQRGLAHGSSSFGIGTRDHQRNTSCSQVIPLAPKYGRRRVFSAAEPGGPEVVVPAFGAGATKVPAVLFATVSSWPFTTDTIGLLSGIPRDGLCARIRLQGQHVIRS